MYIRSTSSVSIENPNSPRFEYTQYQMGLVIFNKLLILFRSLQLVFVQQSPNS